MDHFFYGFLPGWLRTLLLTAELDSGCLQELRLRAGKPLLLQYKGREYGITGAGVLTGCAGESRVVSQEELAETLEYVSGYSMYAFDEEMKQGFLTVSGGHRIGLAGKIVMEGERVQCIRHISFLNIRFSHQVRGCADTLMPYLTQNGNVCHTLIIAPPRCGKTTVLRDVIRQLSDGSETRAGITVGVVDERSELAGSYLGIPQNDLGIRTDVLDGCRKSEGMLMLLRAMSPQVIAVDEIGSTQDGYALESVFHCGCKLLATAHGSSVEDVRRRALLNRMAEQRMFERYVVLGIGASGGRRRQVLDADGVLLYQEDAG